jgi:glucose uptake protein GlcU
MTYQWYDFIGNIGVFLILLTYFLLQINKIDNKTVLYGLLNSFGALFILISLYFDFNLSAFIIEMIWLIISILGIIRYYQRPKNT